MSDQTNETNSGVKPTSTARERVRAKARTTTKPRPASPTRSIEPGIAHYKIAQGILESVRSKAQAAGLNLDVGEFKKFNDVDSDSDNPERLQEVTAHAVARVGDKFSMVRRFSRHLEGADRRAGLLSDILAAAYTLFKRNPDAAEQLGRTFVQNVQEQRRSRVTKQQQQGSPQ